MEDAVGLISSGLFDLPVNLTVRNLGDRFDSHYVIEGYEDAKINSFAELIRKFLKNKVEDI